MKTCKHSKVVFAGIQETLEPNKPLSLFRCLICGSTITLEKRPRQKNVKRITKTA